MDSITALSMGNLSQKNKSTYIDHITAVTSKRFQVQKGVKKQANQIWND